VAGARPISWQRFVAPETMASVDVPTTVFTEDAGNQKQATGGAFLRARDKWASWSKLGRSHLFGKVGRKWHYLSRYSALMFKSFTSRPNLA
jgi:hypothetical protein